MEIKKGYRVVIPKGTLIYGYLNQSQVSKRRQIITVDHILTGYTRHYYDADDNYCEEPVPAEVRWAGSGGYWKGCDINLVEKIDDEENQPTIEND
jgi:hypothetical protein